MTIIDCHTCPVRGHHCASCFVPVVASQWLHGEDAAPAEQPPDRQALPLTDAEWEAVDSFVAAGLVNVLDVVDLVATTEAVPTTFRQVG